MRKRFDRNAGMEMAVKETTYSFAGLNCIFDSNRSDVAENVCIVTGPGTIVVEDA